MTDEKIEIKHGGEDMIDLLNQEQAELVNTQIEKIAQDIYYAIQKECKLNTVGHCNDCEFNLSENAKVIDCQSYLVAKILKQMNYRKLPEDAVVLTKGAYESLSNKARANVVNAVELRKETAREIATKVKECKTIKELVELGYIVSYVDVCNEIDELAKQYGVEVEE